MHGRIRAQMFEGFALSLLEDAELLFRSFVDLEPAFVDEPLGNVCAFELTARFEGAVCPDTLVLRTALLFAMASNLPWGTPAELMESAARILVGRVESTVHPDVAISKRECCDQEVSELLYALL